MRFALAILFLATSLTASPSTERMIIALAIVESGNNPAAIGDQGKATGAWQMWESARIDARRYRPSAKTDIELAGAYLDLLESRLITTLKRPPSLQELYAAYNLGFTGFRRRGFNLDKCPAITQRAAAKYERLATKGK
jgi:hypothetical protein